MKNKIHQYIRRFELLLFLGGALSLGSCEDLLNETTYTQYPTKTFFENVDLMEAAVLQCYSTFQQSSAYGKTMFSMFDGDTDIQHVSGTGAPTGNIIRDAAHYYITPLNTEIESLWSIFYSGINDANLILSMAPMTVSNSIEDDLKIKRLVAETKFLRALIYFDLVRFWGDVPLKLDATVTIGNDFKIGRTKREIIYAQIVKDLEEAARSLPWHDEVTYDGRATKSAAMGMLVRVQLYRGGYSLQLDGTRQRPENWQDYYKESIKWANKLIKSGKHQLNPDYEKIFWNQCQYVWEPEENLFEIDFYYSNSSKGGTIGSYNGVSSKKGVYNSSQVYLRTSYVPYSKFAEEDKRRGVTIANYSLEADGNRKTIAAKSSETWNIGKWSRERQTKDQFDSKGSTSINFVLLRYSDILLMKAEAMNEINAGTPKEREELVNQVRRRGYGLNINQPSTLADMPTSLSREDFLKFIQDERVRELAFESAIRRTDLIRWNILGEKIQETQEFFKKYGGKYVKSGFIFTAAELFTENKHELYPIPERELRENPNLRPQNPGY